MINEIITHLKTGTPSWGTRVVIADELEPPDDLYNMATSLYVYMGEDAASGDGTDSLVSHRMDRTVHISVLCQSANLEAALIELRTAMIGFNPGAADGYDDFQFVSGRLMNKKSGVDWWDEVYSTWVTLREAYS